MNAVTHLYEETLIRNRVLTRTLSNLPDFRYLLRLSSNPDPSRVLVLVHGISRQPAYMLHCLEARAEALNYSLIAPIFNRWSYRDYQRLGRKGRGNRADLAFNAMLDDVATYTGLDAPVHLLGFSGGAQFSHRYTYANAHRVRSLSLASAGWYTAPKSSLRFPHGTAASESLPDVSFNIESLLSTPTLTLVGDQDKERDAAMRRSKKLDSRQGRNRLERALWFHQSLEKLSQQQGYEVSHQFQLLKNTTHDFGEAALRGGLTDAVFNFCEETLP